MQLIQTFIVTIHLGQNPFHSAGCFDFLLRGDKQKKQPSEPRQPARPKDQKDQKSKESSNSPDSTVQVRKIDPLSQLHPVTVLNPLSLQYRTTILNFQPHRKFNTLLLVWKFTITTFCKNGRVDF